MSARLWPGVTVARAAVAVALLQAVFVLAYMIPGRDAEPRDLPVALVGAPAATAPIARRLEQGGFEVLRPRSAAAARTAIERRDAYGALLLDGEQPRALVASAASIVASQVVRGVAEEARVPPEGIEDVVPLTEEDSRGVAFPLLVIPLLVTSVLGGFIVVKLLGRAAPLRGRLLATAGVAAVVGLVTATLVDPVLAVLPGSFLAKAGLLTLSIGGIMLIASGLIRLLGQPGLGVAFLLFLVIGNPASGATSAPELVPQPWQWLGELMPPGPVVTAQRNTAYFDGAALTGPVLALVGAVLVGIALELVAERRIRTRNAVVTDTGETHDR